MKSVILNAEQARRLALMGAYNELRHSRISENFTWGEVFETATNAEIKQAVRQVFDNAVIQAATMEEVRAFFDLAINVHCWYRSPAHNAAVGGVKGSMHLLGLATDFHVDGMASVEANEQVQKKLDKEDFMLDKGLEFTGGEWTHVDSRPPAVGKLKGYRFGGKG